MSSQKSGKTLLGKVYYSTVETCKQNPALFIPFVIFAFLECIGLIFIYLAPRMPVKLLLGPPIRTFWDEKFLHYPANFLLYPKLISLNRMGLSIFFGSLLTGTVVAIIFSIYNKNKINLLDSFKTAMKRYIYLLATVFIFTVLFYISTKAMFIGLTKYFVSGHTKLLFIGPRIWLGPILLCLNFAIAILIQSAFIYVIPILIIEKHKLVQSILKSFVLFKKLFIPTVILVGLPMLLYLPIIILNNNAIFLMTKLFPEIILFVSMLSIIVNSLILDPVITISTTLLYLKNKEK